LRAKIASRAQQVLAAARADGPALEEVVAEIDEGWVEPLDLGPSFNTDPPGISSTNPGRP
jgi:hypothetical protein